MSNLTMPKIDRKLIAKKADIVSDLKNMRLTESFRSLQQYHGKIGDNTFLCGRFLNVFPIGPNKAIIKCGKL